MHQDNDDKILVLKKWMEKEPDIVAKDYIEMTEKIDFLLGVIKKVKKELKNIEE